jgi:DNA ligase (NAD+)
MLSKDKVKSRIEKLKKEIDLHRYNYHVLDKETISEAALDSLKNELFKLEQENPELITKDSPTQRVGGKALDKFEKSTHLSPMLSLFDAFSKEDIVSWQERLKRFVSVVPDWTYYCELKLDGLAVNILYKSSEFLKGSSRGDGKIGENISSNIKTINSVPLKLKNINLKEAREISDKPELLMEILSFGHIEVRGEAIMTKSKLEEINDKYEKEGRPTLSNTRNGAAGSLRQLDPSLSAERDLDFYAYDIILYRDGVRINILKSRQGADLLAKMLGFKILKYNTKCKDLDEVFKFHKYWEENKDKLDFNIDGVVVKINELKWWSVLGVVGKAPRYSMAYKFKADQASTKVKDVVWQLGRTGILTPTAILEPVSLAGAKISRSTLHNMDEINRLDLMIGDTVIIERAGDVIPKVVMVLKNLRSGDEQKIYTPKTCPMCGSEVVKIEDEVAFRCSNNRCYAVNLRQISHFASKRAIDIENLGPKIVEQLLNAGIISDFADLYNIKLGDLLVLDRFAEKSANNLIEAINEKRIIDLDKFIYSLGIRHVGEESARSLADKVFNLLKERSENEELDISDFVEVLSSLDLNFFEEIDDFGPVVSKSVFEYFRDEHNLKVLKKMDKYSVKIRLKKLNIVSNSFFSGKSFLITGSLDGLTREAAKVKIKELGGKILSSVSGNLDFLIVGDKPGSKLKKAESLGLKILKEEEFLEMINKYGNK